MKKKLLLIVICLLLICSCNKKNDDIPNNEIKNDVVKINGKEITLSYENNIGNLYYKENISFYSSTFNNMRNITYSDEGKTIFDIRITYLQYKSLEESKQELTFETTTKTVNNIEYLYGEWDFTDTNTGNIYKAHQYFYQYNNDTYTICIISNENISDFEQAFISNISFR